MQGCGDSKQGQLRWSLNSVRPLLALTMQEFEPSLKTKSLGKGTCLHMLQCDRIDLVIHLLCFFID